MALIKCDECKKKISKKAKSCPNCGAPVKRSSPILRFFGAIFLIFFIISIIASIGEDNSSDSGSQPTKNKKTKTVDKQPFQQEVLYIGRPTSEGLADGLIRTGPGMNYAADDSGSLTESEKLFVLEEKKGWIRFRVTKDDVGWSGWIRKDLTISEKEIKEVREAKYGKAPHASIRDGSVRCVKEYLKKVAKDPDSLKYEDWSEVYYNDEDGWLVKCSFRAKNSFGAYERDTKWFVIQHGYVVDVKEIGTY